MEFCPEIDQRFCDLLAAAKRVCPGFIDLCLWEEYEPHESYEGSSDIYYAAYNLLSAAQAKNLDPRYIRRITSFCRWLSIYMGEQYSFNDNMFWSYGLDAAKGDLAPFTDSELWAQKAKVEKLASEIGMDNLGRTDLPFEDIYRDLEWISIEDMLDLSKQVHQARLSAVATELGSIPSFKYKFEETYKENVAWKCWLNGNGKDFTHQYNRWKFPYNQTKLPKFIPIISSDHETTHAIEAALRRQDIIKGKRPLSDAWTWSTDPYQFSSEALALRIGQLCPTEYSIDPAVQFGIELHTLIDMIQNNVQLAYEAGASYRQVEHFVNSWADGHIYATSSSVRLRQQGNATLRMYNFLYALGATAFGCVQTRDPEKGAELLSCAFTEPMTAEAFRGRFGDVRHQYGCDQPEI